MLVLSKTECWLSIQVLGTFQVLGHQPLTRGVFLMSIYYVAAIGLGGD